MPGPLVGAPYSVAQIGSDGVPYFARMVLRDGLVDAIWGQGFQTAGSCGATGNEYGMIPDGVSKPVRSEGAHVRDEIELRDVLSSARRRGQPAGNEEDLRIGPAHAQPRRD